MSDAFSGHLVDGGHVFPVRVYFEDTDLSGIVYYARYLHFLERGRTEMLRLKGITSSRMGEGGYGEPMAFAVRRLEIDYLRSARIDDVLTVTTRVEHVSGARVVLDQRIFRQEKPLLAATVTVVVVTSDGRARRLPAAVAAALTAVEPE
ncbi:tol-pal system-associated acyl-CoA thioesterase [Consotaella aegiceratis]|uniref:tol-pal system-associated acyl-CoA thioesterase n=1 Tax=Consotaella aegiceratis TaxID=3097961 RepID=UPI002F3F2A55